MNANYLPFVVREVFRMQNLNFFGNTIALPGTPQLSALSTGGRTVSRNFLQDISVELIYGTFNGQTRAFSWSGGNPLIADTFQAELRLGWKSKGYLLEEPIAYGVFANKGASLAQCWQFQKPYRIYPGEMMRAEARESVQVAGDLRYSGILFNGVKDDGKPHLLTDAGDVPMDQSANLLPQALNGIGLTCPADSAVDIHGMTFFRHGGPTAFFPPIMQVWGPDGREWFKTRAIGLEAAGVLPTAMTHQHWICPRVPSIELGEERGWVMHPSETLAMELRPITALANASDIWAAIVTVRGCSEVPMDGRGAR